MILSIKNWDALYENNRTRELKHMEWIAMPNGMDGLKFIKFMKHPNADAHYGAWVKLLSLASRMPRRGYLVTDSGHKISPQDAAELTRGAEAVFIEAVRRLLEIGWIEEVASIPGTKGAGIPQDDAVQPPRKGREGELNGNSLSPPVGLQNSTPQAQSTDEAVEFRKRILAVLNKFGCAMTMKGEPIFLEWCQVCRGYTPEWVEHLFAKKRIQASFPSDLRKALKAYAAEYQEWKEAHKKHKVPA